MIYYSIGYRLVVRALILAQVKGISDEITKILAPFIADPDELDLRTISVLESKLGEKLLIIPTKKELRKIKLQHLNDISNEF
jgi:hypothetical protein